MELLLLYLWMKLNTLAVVNGIAIGVCVVVGVIILICQEDAPKVPKRYTYDTREEWELACEQQRKAWANRWELRVLPRLRWIIPALIALFVVMPSQTQTAVLVAGHYALRMADSPEASKVMMVLRKKANEYLDEELKDVKK